MRLPKPPSRDLIDAIAQGIDRYREKHPDLLIGEIIDAFQIVKNELVAASERQRP